MNDELLRKRELLQGRAGMLRVQWMRLGEELKTIHKAISDLNLEIAEAEITNLTPKDLDSRLEDVIRVLRVKETSQAAGELLLSWASAKSSTVGDLQPYLVEDEYLNFVLHAVLEADKSLTEAAQELDALAKKLVEVPDVNLVNVTVTVKGPNTDRALELEYSEEAIFYFKHEESTWKEVFNGAKGVATLLGHTRSKA